MTTRFPGDDDTDETRPLIPAPVADQILKDAMRRANHYPTGTLFVGRDGAWQELGGIDSEGFISEPEPGMAILDEDFPLPAGKQEFSIDFRAMPAFDHASDPLFGPEVLGPRDPLFSLAFEHQENVAIPRPAAPVRSWKPWTWLSYRRELRAWHAADQAWLEGPRTELRKVRTFIPRACLT